MVFSSTSLLTGLLARAIRQIRSLSPLREYDADAYVSHQEEPALVNYLILEGQAKGVQPSQDVPEIILHVLGSGDLIGALPTQLRPADPGSAAALCRPIVFAIPAWGFKRVLRDHPQVAVDLLKTAAEAIQEALARVREASTLPVEARITLTLQRLTPASDEHCSEG